MKKISKFLKENLIIFIALGGLIYGGVMLSSGGNNTTKTNDDIQVWVIAKNSVESNLKSPTSAKFPSKDKAKISKSGDGYVVKSYVDADNSFGAKTRSNFTVVITEDLDGKYIVSSVIIDE